MAKQSKARAADAPAALPASFDPEAQYRVRLKSPITVGAVLVRPWEEVMLRGDAAEANRAAIVSAEKV